jgi:hypothetical protein
VPAETTLNAGSTPSGSIEKMPTDFVGMIYKSVDLSAEDTVVQVVRAWIKDDLTVGNL